MRPVEPLPAKSSKLLADLNAEEFGPDGAAKTRAAGGGWSASSATSSGRTSAERRDMMGRLLTSWRAADRPPTGERLRVMRAVAALELTGTADHGVLVGLAGAGRRRQESAGPGEGRAVTVVQRARLPFRRTRRQFGYRPGSRSAAQIPLQLVSRPTTGGRGYAGSTSCLHSRRTAPRAGLAPPADPRVSGSPRNFSQHSRNFTAITCVSSSAS